MLGVYREPDYIQIPPGVDVVTLGCGAVAGRRGREAFVSVSESGHYEWWTTTVTSRPLRSREEAVQYAATGFLETEPAPLLIRGVVRPLGGAR